MINTTSLMLDVILEKAEQENPLSREELKFLLTLSEESDLSKVFTLARQLRRRYFEDKLFIYGFVYFSTYCRNDCAFCLYRRSNHALDRYRKTDLEIMETVSSLVKSGVHLVDLTMGEDPQYFDNRESGFAHLISTVEQIKDRTGIPIMISAGVVPEQALREFKAAGADWYAVYQETHNPDLYHKLRLGQSYTERMERKKLAHKLGFLIEEGLLTGVGDTEEDLVNSLERMRDLGAEQVRVMSFVPQKGTPMQDVTSVSRHRELLIIAVMRLIFPDRLIPASLDVDGLNGLANRLNAGANVITSVIPPHSGLAGVSNHSLDIEDGNRTISKIIPVLAEQGLALATRDDFAEWIRQRQTLIIPSGGALV
ncbi:methylornithine synthase PylB [Desulfosporosinus youngiae]|uniref:Pyrrolysine biosynthesis radical SAM protein n=1 Tax=Desulfosporosinus youngiae DSM 17734 TaxID=768710 RepID=H5Y371_9FIRM|nr:methylornithine synthase PylB [Desulfosporosinus youngiae]EHQ88766.1 pyrrolysine biosynthesis radical SAM protein [Desulfosporosinus youngiae DSM 17734]